MFLRGLKDHLDVLTLLFQCGALESLNVSAQNAYFTFEIHHIHQRTSGGGFTATAFTDDAQGFSLVQGETDVFNGYQLSSRGK